MICVDCRRSNQQSSNHHNVFIICSIFALNFQFLACQSSKEQGQSDFSSSVFLEKSCPQITNLHLQLKQQNLFQFRVTNKGGNQSEVFRKIQGLIKD